MQLDFHYYATYCAAILAGYSPDDSLELARSAQFVDCCTRTLLEKLKAPRAAATTQLQLEMMDARTDVLGLQDITRIWASFHFLPRDLHAEKPGCPRRYLNKYRLICGPNSELLKETVELAKEAGNVEAAGIAMHVLADTWAHSYFAGTPSLVINNTNYHFFELLPDGSERPVVFRHSPSGADDPEAGVYSGSIFQMSENSIMNLGHGRAGHLPDYSFMRYRYLPAWGEYAEIVKDNPSDYWKAFCQMVCALRYLHGETDCFEPDTYDTETVVPYEDEIRTLIAVRRLNACSDWKALGERLSGCPIPDFNTEVWEEAYLTAEEKDRTALGRFILAALNQKSLVTNRIYSSGNLLAGFSVDFWEKGFKGIKDYGKLVDEMKEKMKKMREEMLG